MRPLLRDRLMPIEPARIVALAAFLLVAARAQPPAGPLQFIHIQEDTGGSRIVELYNPAAKPPLGSQILQADVRSMLRISIDPDALPNDAALNRIGISATLAHRGGSAKSVNVEIAGYSQIDKDPGSQASQTAAAFQTAGQLQNDISALYFTTQDLIEAMYAAESDCIAEPGPQHCADLSSAARSVRFRKRLALLRPEILRIAADVAGPNQAALGQLVGASIFGLSPSTLLDIRAQFEADLAAAFDPDKQDTARDAALEQLAQRVRLVWIDLREIAARIRARRISRPGLSPDAAAAQVFQDLLQSEVLALKKRLVTGTIDLTAYQAAAGDVLTLTVDAGSPASFRIELGNYRLRNRAIDSAFFIRRLRDVPGKRVNFTPAAGVTYGPMFYSRPGRSAWTRLRSAFAPGIGIGVSIMNFPDYDPASGLLTAPSSQVQVGAGFVASIFAGAVQFTYGWNLNVSSSRSYWGVGFSFVSLLQDVRLVSRK
ncbi:MAG: hypothetical protein ACRD9L_06315 [Bryobacteraceae bacterium]